MSEEEISISDITKMPIDTLLEHIENIDVCGYIFSNYREIIREIPKQERMEKCNKIAEALQRLINEEKDVVYAIPVNRAIVSVTRSGMHAYYELNVNKGGLLPMNPNDRQILFSLHYYNSIGLIGLNRPFLALLQIHKALEYNMILEQFVKDHSENKDRMPAIYINRGLALIYLAKIYETIFPDLDEESRTAVAPAIISMYKMYSEIMKDLGETSIGADLSNIYESFSIRLKIEEIEIDEDGYLIKINNFKMPDDKIYEEWCWNKHYLLNLTNELPIMDENQLKDNLFITTDEVNKIRMDEICRIYEHCRRILYRHMQEPELARLYFKPGEQTESLLDCYYRIFSLLDKIAKVISKAVYDDQIDDKSFRNVCNNLRSNSNDYLRGIFEIYKDLYMNEDADLGFMDEFYSAHRVKKKPNTIRNKIAHSTLYFVSRDDD